MSTTPLTFDLDQTLPTGLRLPARMTALPLAEGGLALVSPIPIDASIASALSAVGEVRYLIAPNLLHHLYLADAIARYPRATVLAPRGLRRKRPDLRIDGDLEDGLPQDLAAEVEAIRIDGIPSLDEFVFFHRASRTLVVTDLVFHVERPQGFVTHLVLWLVGCHGRLGQSRALRLLTKDRAAAAASAERLLILPFETLVMAHGEIVRERAAERLAAALEPMRAAGAARPSLRA